MRKTFTLALTVLVAAGTWFFFQNFKDGGLQQIGLQWPDSSNAPAGAPLDARPPVRREGQTIRIASFNIQVFGTSKVNKPAVMDYLARIARNFDVMAIQEIRSKDEDILPLFVDKINETGLHYDHVIGPRLGRTNSKEQYAFVFDTASVEVDRTQLYTVDDPDDLLHREPYVAWFRVRGPPAEDAFTFSLVNIHTDPDETDLELDVLDDVMMAVRNDGRNEDDVILLGDLNVDDRHMGDLANVSGIHWVISGVPTNVRGTALYDNLVFQSLATTEFTGRAGVFDFMREYNLTMDQALEVSDHLPIWAEFTVYEGGQPGRVAGQPGRPL
jgi:endonuclease/exonuclease/phosphatase family metal-dependent hydrolase